MGGEGLEGEAAYLHTPEARYQRHDVLAGLVFVDRPVPLAAFYRLSPDGRLSEQLVWVADVADCTIPVKLEQSDLLVAVVLCLSAPLTRAWTVLQTSRAFGRNWPLGEQRIKEVSFR